MSEDTCPLCKNNNCDYRDTRVNSQEISNDKVYAELAHYLHKYESLEKRFAWKSKVTRLFAKSSLPVMILAISSLLFEKMFNINVLPERFSVPECLQDLLPLLAVLSIAIFFGAFFINRLAGYTRGWSRNRLMKEHIERLVREYQLAIHGKDSTNTLDKEFLDAEQENMLAKLFQLEENNRTQTHKDIVGDYLSAHDGAFGWIKGLKK
ncbi:TPA: hypothetical protein ACPV0G_003343 [Vibrio parahaemolyticus]|uniref:hypothetical protein n=1 Tax=Vibrio parahaemolyticus TaxID=670 RepID=UPI001B83A11C|nr:hypothetical protein [Vibrio parahaemolyticus]MCG0026086.1 hypothetical protein [Vibrio parahaemolyticus]MCX8936438.1 hypothetical protein [Vibrio parahaemolyticus]MDF4915998.1 hypothetical protein [Vibrio parahaemolyticus]HBC3954220.1 hypothetical protein [Vibrio parahaemolyticus]HDF8081262.1 hypothetical protein [Vibrio parahaemolyticus]